MWQAQAARVRRRYARDNKPFRLGWASRTHLLFTHGCLLKFSREGLPFDPYWWA